LFGAVTIVLGVLALVIAGLAIWGYTAIKDESKRVSSEAAAKAITAYIQGQEIQSLLRAETQKLIDDGMKQVLEAADIAISQIPRPDAEPSADDSESVGKKYPKSGEGQ
jgi:hypothetical protein